MTILNLNTYIYALHFNVAPWDKFALANILKYDLCILCGVFEPTKTDKYMFMQFKNCGEMQYTNYNFIVRYTILSTLVFPLYLEERIHLFSSYSPWHPLVVQPTPIMELVQVAHKLTFDRY